MPPITRADELPADYPQFLADVKTRIASAQTRAVLAVNSELIRLYWEIGRGILEREDRQGWGAKVVDTLAVDLRRELPNTTGFSPRNLRYMRDFSRAWPEEAMLPQAVAKLSWGRNIALQTKLKDPDTRVWAAEKAVQHGWSRCSR